MSLDYTKTERGFPRKVFYWCSNSNFIFSNLPETLAKNAKKFVNLQTYFTGEYERVLYEEAGQPQVVDEEKGLVMPGKNITELDRLSYVVRKIDDYCAIVPKG